MKIAVSISLLLLLSFQVMFKTFLVIDYRVNKAYVAANLCVNKATPQMQCEGKCHLKKQITQSEEAESKTIPSSLKEKEVSFHQSWFELRLPQISVLIESNQYHLPAEEAIVSVSSSIFQPPQLAA